MPYHAGRRSATTARRPPIRTDIRPPRAAPPARGADRRHADAIERSHLRCAARGLSRIESAQHVPLARADLSLVHERNRRLFGHAAPVMEMLYGHIVDSDSMVVLCDAAGTIIHAIGDDDFLARAQKVALQPGVDWSEPAKGTNAIGTALVDEAPTVVHAEEHYLHANHFLTCSAAPILDPRGRVLGALDVTGDQRGYHRHTLALVTMSARMIENHWLDEDLRHALRLRLHRRAEFVGTLMEGIVAVGADGRIVGANRSATEQLGLDGVALRRHTVESLFGVGLGALVDRLRAALVAPLALTLHDGRRVHVQARVEGPAWQALAVAVPSRPAPPPAGRAVVADAPPAPRCDPVPRLSRLLGDDAALARVVQRLRCVLDGNVNIVVTGEAGTGKTWLAQALHHESRRAGEPLLVVDCADAALAEAALFGAGGERGTVILDDVDALAPALQQRLRRQLRRDAPPAPLWIGTTRRDLRPLVAAGHFDADLHQRLSGLTVRLPPLRERADIDRVASQLLALDAAPALDADALALLRTCRWPGNLRQLRERLHVAALLARGRTCITRDDLADDADDAAVAGHDDDDDGAPAPECDAAARTLDQVEVETIRAALAACGGNVSAAARRLGIGRNTIYRRLRGDAAAR